MQSLDAGIIVLGGGPAGLMCAIAASGHASVAGGRVKSAGNPATSDRTATADCAAAADRAEPGRTSPHGVLLLEKMPRPGIKLLTTGSGRCNITHSGGIADFLGHYGKHGRFLKPALFGFTNDDLLSFFESKGLSFVTEENGKVFPVSGGARAVLDLLLTEAGMPSPGSGQRPGTSFPVRMEEGHALSRVTIRPGFPATSIVREDDAFTVLGPSGSFRAPAVCIAAGGASYPGTGSSGDGYVLASSLGHAIVRPFPCLTPLGIHPWHFTGCSGFALRERTISVFREGRKTAQGSGDVLFTHTGLSGPGILDLSRNIREGDEVSFALMDLERDIDLVLLDAIGSHGKRELKTILHGFGLPDALARAVAEHAGMDPAIRACEIGRAGRKALSSCLKACRLRVSAPGDFSQAMATAGGVDLAEVNPGTMESKTCPGLFFAGEVLDYDGDTGGYNLQAAFSTGWLAGISARASAIARLRRFA